MLILVHKAHETLLAWQGDHVGRLLSPRHFARADATAAAGIPWAADNDCYQGLDEDAYRGMLTAIYGLPGCRFVTAPDVVEDWRATRDRFAEWYSELVMCSHPVAYVLQDGQPQTGVPWRLIDALFIGGSSEYKLSDDAYALAREAKRRGLWLHMGRVNTEQRMRVAKSWGCDSIDGTSVSKFTNRRLPERIGQAAAPRQLNLKEIK